MPFVVMPGMDLLGKLLLRAMHSGDNAATPHHVIAAV